MSDVKAGDAVRVWPNHSPERRQFSVLCYRGWCDHDFKCRDIGAMLTAVTGTASPPPTHLPARECPTPDTCQCECHDEARPTLAKVTKTTTEQEG